MLVSLSMTLSFHYHYHYVYHYYLQSNYNTHPLIAHPFLIVMCLLASVVKQQIHQRYHLCSELSPCYCDNDIVNENENDSVSDDFNYNVYHGYSLYDSIPLTHFITFLLSPSLTPLASTH